MIQLKEFMKVIKFFSIFLILYCQPVFTYSILIDISEQRLYLKKNESIVIKSYSISSSFLGEGQVENSFKTPLGNHIIAKKIGENADIGTNFNERVNTGRIASIIKEKKDNSLSLVFFKFNIKKCFLTKVSNRFVALFCPINPLF